MDGVDVIVTSREMTRSSIGSRDMTDVIVIVTSREMTRSSIGSRDMTDVIVTSREMTRSSIGSRDMTVDWRRVSCSIANSLKIQRKQLCISSYKGET